MKKIIYIPIFFLIIIFISLMLLNKETSRKIAINYNKFEYEIPLYLGLNNFFNRHFNYKYLVKKINVNQKNQEDIIINTTKWVNQNIQKVPEGVDVVDSDPLTIVQRRLGVQDQFNDILSVFFVYLNIDSFFIKKHGDVVYPLTLFKVNNYWSVLDPYYGIYFTNEKGTFASIEDLKTTKWDIVNLDSQKINSLNISNIFSNQFKNYADVEEYYRQLFFEIESSKKIDDMNIFDRSGKAYIQKPLNRLKYEINKILKKNFLLFE